MYCQDLPGIFVAFKHSTVTFNCRSCRKIARAAASLSLRPATFSSSWRFLFQELEIVGRTWQNKHSWRKLGSCLEPQQTLASQSQQEKPSMTLHVPLQLSNLQTISAVSTASLIATLLKCQLCVIHRRKTKSFKGANKVRTFLPAVDSE